MRGVAMRFTTREAESVAEARIGGHRFSYGTLDVAADRAIARGRVPRLGGFVVSGTAARTLGLGPAEAVRTRARSRRTAELKLKR